MENVKEVLYDWIFIYNPYRDEYQAVKRENFQELYSGDKGGVLRSKDFKTLESLIIKTNGSKDKIEELLKNQ